MSEKVHRIFRPFILPLVPFFYHPSRPDQRTYGRVKHPKMSEIWMEVFRFTLVSLEMTRFSYFIKTEK